MGREIEPIPIPTGDALALAMRENDRLRRRVAKLEEYTRRYLMTLEAEYDETDDGGLWHDIKEIRAVLEGAEHAPPQ